MPQLFSSRFCRQLQQFDAEDFVDVVLGPLPNLVWKVQPEVDPQVRRRQRGRHLQVVNQS